MGKVYTVIWERVDVVGTNESMLGYSLAWEGIHLAQRAFLTTQVILLNLIVLLTENLVDQVIFFTATKCGPVEAHINQRRCAPV